MTAWKHTILGGHIDLLTGFPFKSNEYSDGAHDVRLLRGDNISQGFLRWNEARRWPPEKLAQLEKYSLRSGDIVVAMDRTWVKAGLKCTAVNEVDLPCLLVQRVARIRGTNGLRTCYLSHLLRTQRFETYVKGVQTESAVPHISAQQIRDFPIALPSEYEQQEIARHLDTWDRVISLTEGLIAAKLEQRKGLMQQLLSGKRRFPEFSEPWREVRLREIFERITKAATDGDDDPEPLSITAGVGFVRQRDKFSRVIAGKNLERYVLLQNGEFAYNKGNSKRYPQGCVYRLSTMPTGLVPNVFYSFRSASPEVHPEFYGHYFESGALNHALSRVINTGVRNDGLLNLDAKAFFAVRVPLPPRAEQEQLAQVLQMSKNEIDLLQTQLAALKEQKKGLMQQLLTGKKRVKVTEEAA